MPDVFDIAYSDACDEHGMLVVDEWLADYGLPYEQTARARREQAAMDLQFGGLPGVDGVEVIE